MGARGGCWGGWHGEHSMPLPLLSPLPDGDAETTHRNLLPRSCGDADLAGPPDQEKVVGPQPRVQGSNTNQTPTSELFIFILKEKQKNKKTSAKSHFPVSAMPTPNTQVSPPGSELDSFLPLSTLSLLMQPSRGWRLHFPGVLNPSGT